MEWQGLSLGCSCFSFCFHSQWNIQRVQQEQRDREWKRMIKERKENMKLEKRMFLKIRKKCLKREIDWGKELERERVGEKIEKVGEKEVLKVYIVI